MGDSRFDGYYERIVETRDRQGAIRALPDEGVIAALAASALRGDRYTTNVLATEAMNRLHQPRMSRHLPTHSVRDDKQRLADAVADIKPGDHLCLIHASAEEQFAAAVAYIRAGLVRNERCLYVADSTDASVIEQALRDQGTDPAPYIESGALLILTQREAYLKNGKFDPDWMIGFLDEAVRETEAQGYAHLRVTGEMTWALGEDIGGEKLLEYESKLNRYFPGRNVSAICQYDHRRFGAETLIGVVQTHPKLVYGSAVCDNFYYVPPDEFLSGVTSPEAALHRLLESVRTRAEAEQEIVRLNEDLEHLVVERTNELEEAVRELESFSYTVSHDLRAPLRGIDFYAQALEEDHGSRLDEDGLALLGRLRGESQRLSGLVTHLLALGGVARAELRPVPLDLSQMAREVVETLRASEPSRIVDVVIEDDMGCVGDEHLVRMLLQNLLANAWKFTRRTPSPRIRVRRVEEAGEMAFEVSDNGAGFDPAKGHKLFNAFSRLHAPSDFEGNGVGLATVARVARRHGGRAWADGRVGEGATFWFTLAAPMPAGADGPAPAAATAVREKPSTVRVRGPA